MAPNRPDNQILPVGTLEFSTTHWSLVLRAGNCREPDAESALTWLCERYWFPLYAYARRQGHESHEAEDLTQEFFTRLIEKNVLAVAAPERGRFRSFLLTAMKNLLANEWDRKHTQKRGGGRPQLSIHFETAESRLDLESRRNDSPDQLFEHQWVMTLLELVVSKLRSEFTAQGKARQFELLKGAITGEGDLETEAVVAELGLSAEAVRQAASRLRKRYRELFREEVGKTVAEPDEVDDEIRNLYRVLGS